MEQLMEKYHVTDQEDGRKNLLKIINANVYYAVEEVINLQKCGWKENYLNRLRLE